MKYYGAVSFFRLAANENGRTVMEPQPAIAGGTVLKANPEANRTWGARTIPRPMVASFDLAATMSLSSRRAWQLPTTQPRTWK